MRCNKVEDYNNSEDNNNDIEISGAIDAIGMPKLKPGGVINIDIPNTPMIGNYKVNSYTQKI